MDLRRQPVNVRLSVSFWQRRVSAGTEGSRLVVSAKRVSSHTHLKIVVGGERLDCLIELGIVKNLIWNLVERDTRATGGSGGRPDESFLGPRG